jgi:hypothetical protein
MMSLMPSLSLGVTLLTFPMLNPKIPMSLDVVDVAVFTGGEVVDVPGVESEDPDVARCHGCRRFHWG